MAAGERYWVVLDRQGAQVKTSPAKPQGFSEVLGPYPTRSEAQQVANLLNKRVVQNPTVPQEVINDYTKQSGIGKVAHWVGDFVLHLVDVHMWISIGWLLLGLLLIFTGLATWLKLPQKALKVAPLALA